MASEALYIWSETVPNWLMAVSALSAAVVFLWRRQDRKETSERREEAIRDSVNAVWVTAKVGDSEQRRWGVLVTNDLQVPVKDVKITCGGNRGSSVLAHTTIQPGKHFFESLPSGSARAWALPTSDISKFEFITASSTHRTNSISFTHAGNDYERSLD